MTVFDVAVIGLVMLSTLLAFVRGVVRELIALASWVLGIVLALAYAGRAARLFGWVDVAPELRVVLAFTLIFVAALVAGALVGIGLSRAIHAVGLSFVDRFLGGAFGLVRGMLLVVLFALVAGLTTLPRHDWWQNSAIGQPLATVALALRPWLPPAWAGGLDFSATGAAPARGGGRSANADFGERRTCAAS